MPFTPVGDRLINLDLVTTVETNVRAQHPDNKRPVKDQYVDDAVRVEFSGGKEPLLLFDADAAALLAVVAPAPAKPATVTK